jgi:hypothetical protein
METIMQLVALAKAHAWTTLLLHGALALILLAVARRSQIDSWAESNPKIAGVLKILRGLGIDPWLVLSGLSLLIRGRLPKDPPSSGSAVGKASDYLPKSLTTLGLCLFAFVATGCAGAEKTLRSIATERGARDTAMAVCAVAHSWDGQIPEAETVVRWCAKAEFVQPWAELAAEAKAIVDAQRAGKPRPDPDPQPEPVPAPPPVPPSEPALAPKPNEA